VKASFAPIFLVSISETFADALSEKFLE